MEKLKESKQEEEKGKEVFKMSGERESEER